MLYAPETQDAAHGQQNLPLNSTEPVLSNILDVILSEAKDLCISGSLRECIDPSVRKPRGPQDDSFNACT